MTRDHFHELSRYYDALMDEIDYDRWVVALSYLRDLVDSADTRHLDVACGTGQLLRRLRQHGWNSVGVDSSCGMVREAAAGPYPGHAAAGDMTALPFNGEFGLITCLFDSLNFLLEPDAFRGAVCEAARLLPPGGIYYCDTITERMVTEHFAGRKWEEVHGKMRAEWEGTWDVESRIAELDIRIGTGRTNTIRERVYSDADVRGALADAGLEVLGSVDAETWKDPTYKTLRIDWIAAKPPAPHALKHFDRTRDAVRQALA